MGSAATGKRHGGLKLRNWQAQPSDNGRLFSQDKVSVHQRERFFPNAILMTLRSTSRRNVRVGRAKLKCFTPFRNRRSADAPEAGHVKVHSRRSQVIQGKRGHLRSVQIVAQLIETKKRNDGEGGIRTHGGVTPTPVFETGLFNRSSTSPEERPPILAANGQKMFCYSVS